MFQPVGGVEFTNFVFVYSYILQVCICGSTYRLASEVAFICFSDMLIIFFISTVPGLALVLVNLLIGLGAGKGKTFLVC